MAILKELTMWLKELNPENLDELRRLTDDFCALARQGKKGKPRRTEQIFDPSPLLVKQEWLSMEM